MKPRNKITTKTIKKTSKKHKIKKFLKNKENMRKKLLKIRIMMLNLSKFKPGKYT